MILLDNGVRIFPNSEMTKDIFIGISNFGFESDVVDGLLGVSHLLEHVLIKFDHLRFMANASTGRTSMNFWCEAIKPEPRANSIMLAISWFFDKNWRLRTDFSRVNIANYIRELENEYQFRKDVINVMDVLTFLLGGDLYNGGRITMLEAQDRIRELMSQRMCRLAGSNFVIFVRALTEPVLAMLERSFGSLPRFPAVITPPLSRNLHNKIVMVPAPMYRLVIRVDNTIENMLAILCVANTYHFVDYDTIGERLFLEISFVCEEYYEDFLRNIENITFDVSSRVLMDYDDESLMNIYLAFPRMQRDLMDYLFTLNTSCDTLVRNLERNMRHSVRQRELVVVYPTFTPSLYNTHDSQDHRLIVLDVAMGNVGNAPAVGGVQSAAAAPCVNFADRAFLRKSVSELFVRYSDPAFLNYVSLALSNRAKWERASDISFRCVATGAHFTHCFDDADINKIIVSDSFVKFNRSRPAALYPYIFLSFFATGKSLDDILKQRDSPSEILIQKYKLVFPKRSRYDVVTKTTFVSGLLKGARLHVADMRGYLWDMKARGLLYTMNYTPLDKNTFFVFAFTIYPDRVFRYFTRLPSVNKYCLVVSARGTLEDYSSLRKEVVLTFA